MLLPAPRQFELESGGSRLNPSYYPVQLLRVFATADSTGGWDQVIANSVKLLDESSPKGYAPDWVSYIPGQGYLSDMQHAATGSYDAIRVYLWWGMLSRQDAESARLKKIIYGMNQLIPKQEVTPPETVNAQTGAVSGISPPSFSAALLPYFSAMGNKTALRLQRERLIAQQDASTGILIGVDPRYYDQVLALFGLGWMEHRFAFSPQGQLVAPWKSSCSAKK